MLKYHDRFELLIQHLLFQAIDRPPNHFLTCWTEQQQQQQRLQVAPIKTLCLDVLSRKFIMSNPLLCLSSGGWGVLEELFSGQQNETVLYKLTTEWFLSFDAPSLFNSTEKRGEWVSNASTLCIHYCIDIPVKPLGNSRYTAGYSTDLQLYGTVAFKICYEPNWLRKESLARSGGNFNIHSYQYGNINTCQYVADIIINMLSFACYHIYCILTSMAPHTFLYAFYYNWIIFINLLTAVFVFSFIVIFNNWIIKCQIKFTAHYHHILYLLLLLS